MKLKLKNFLEENSPVSIGDFGMYYLSEHLDIRIGVISKEFDVQYSDQKIRKIQLKFGLPSGETTVDVPKAWVSQTFDWEHYAKVH